MVDAGWRGDAGGGRRAAGDPRIVCAIDPRRVALNDIDSRVCHLVCVAVADSATESVPPIAIEIQAISGGAGLWRL